MTFNLCKTLRILLIYLCCFVLVWQLALEWLQLPNFLLPSPLDVFQALHDNADILWHNTLVTCYEIALSLFFGVGFGILFALVMLYIPKLQQWLEPVFIASQSIPTFAIAPLIILWFGFGVASKVIIASLLIFFPMTVSTYQGLAQTPKGYLDLAQTMNTSRWHELRHIRFPSALPMIAAGLKVAVAVAPIGVVIGEWSGASEGLGHYMMYSNGRMEVAEMFAGLIILSLCSVSLYYGTQALLKRVLHWVDNP
jgi:putative hydroxymethylpyrimidine transport system permease protein